MIGNKLKERYSQTMIQLVYEIWDNRYHGRSDVSEIVYSSKDYREIVNVLKVLGEIYGLKRYSIMTSEEKVAKNG